ncbi:MAG: hypothetical protein LBT16_02475, partial [Treponema sp.]|nr:hypothetical protein [Treponema sp.]
ESLVCAIRYHHDPASVPVQFKILTETVYLANMLCEYEIHNVTFDQFDSAVLDSFNISNKTQIEGLIERFQANIGKENG